METAEKVETKKEKVNHGRVIRHLRGDAGLTQKELGDRIGLSQQTIARNEKEEILDDEILQQYAKGFGVSLDFIKNMEDKPLAQYVYNTYNVSENQKTENIGECASVTNNENIGENPSTINNIGVDNPSLKTILDNVGELCKKTLDQYNDLIKGYIEILHACKPEVKKEEESKDK